MGPTAVIVVNHPGGIDNCALLPAERGLRVGRDILRYLTRIGAVPPNESETTRSLCESKERSPLVRVLSEYPYQFPEISGILGAYCWGLDSDLLYIGTGK